VNVARGRILWRLGLLLSPSIGLVLDLVIVAEPTLGISDSLLQCIRPGEHLHFLIAAVSVHFFGAPIAGDLRAALGRIKAKTFVMPMSSDMFFPPADCQAEWRLIPEAEFRPIQTIDGHLALFGADPNAISQLDKHLSELLATKI
jgi:homoserine acetyltransferase